MGESILEKNRKIDFIRTIFGTGTARAFDVVRLNAFVLVVSGN
jgi:hypothetical protein